MCREGKVDKLSGQTAAFPINELDDSEDSARVREYIEFVNSEARNLLFESRQVKRPFPDKQPSVRNSQSRRVDATPKSSALCYSEPLFSVYELEKLTKECISLPSISERLTLETLYKRANAAISTALQSPDYEEPKNNSQAQWVEFMKSNKPVSLKRTMRFRIIRYLNTLLQKLDAEHNDQYVLWAWMMMLANAEPLQSNEVSDIRELAKTLKKQPNNGVAVACVQLVGTCFGQRDLLEGVSI